MAKKEQEECKELVLEAKAKSTGEWIYPVSYTHLTLPTNREV